MTEPIRLVIWDLDETFWRGTVSEGGCEYRQDCHDIVIELARRGIVSSICSKNNAAQIETILRERGLWEYFIFPSISWDAKGPRIAATIEDIGLRSASCLFIDDNVGNLHEALHFVPDLQVSEPSIIPLLLSDARCKGKEDSNRSRLAQYRALEERKRNEASAGANVEDFLRSSGICISIEHDIAPHLDRAIELINRTNQLNFTKSRLPENLVEARTELLRQIEPYDVQAALIRVVDRYGDHGFCGLYVMHRSIADTRRQLIHFCFSCRILGMGVEQFLYQLLGRPEIAIAGAVVSDLNARKDIDWISIGETLPEQKAANGRSVFLHGGCDMMNLAHYANTTSSQVIGEYDILRHGMSMRLDHCLMKRYAIQGATAEIIRIGAMLGYEPDDFRSQLFEAPRDGLWVLSLAADGWVTVWQHSETGLLFPFVFTDVPGVINPLNIPQSERPEKIRNPEMRRMIETLEREFTYCGPIDRRTFIDCLNVMLSRIPSTSEVLMCYPFYDRHFRWLRKVAKYYRNVQVQLLADLNTGGHPVRNNHFDRIVYFRLYQVIQKMALRSTVRAA
jgi:FkbH-like protein